MKKTYFVLLVLLGLSVQSSCSFHAMLTPPYKTYEIPLSGKAKLGNFSADGIFLGSYNIDQYENVVEKEINIFKYNFKNHTKEFSYQMKNTRMNFSQLVEYDVPYIYQEEHIQTLIWQRWAGSTYTISKSVDEKKEIIFERYHLSKERVILFVIVDSRQNNQVLIYFSSHDQFESKIFEIYQHDIHTGDTRKISEGSGRLFSTPYYETGSYIYLEVRDIGQPRKIFCIRKSDFTLEKITPIDRQYLVGSDYNSDLLIAYNHKTFELTLWKGSAIQQVIPCSSYPYEVDSVTLKVHQNKLYLVAVIEEGFDSERRFLRWIHFDPATKQLVEKNWNQDLKYRLARGNYVSDKNDFYIHGYERPTRIVVFGIVNIIEGTIHFRPTDHRIPKDLEFEGSEFIGDQYCLWYEGTAFNNDSVTGEKQTYNPTGYYCSLEEPLLLRFKK